MGTRFEGQAVVVRRRAWFLWASLLGSLANVVPASLMHGPVWLRPIAMYVGLGFLFLFIRNAWPIRRRAEVRADAKGLWIDGALAVRRERIVSGYALAGPPPAVRVVQKAWRDLPLDVELSEPEAPRALLDALGLGVAGSTARFSVIHGGNRRQLQLSLAVALAAGLTATIMAITVIERPGAVSLPVYMAAALVPLLVGFMPVLRSQGRLTVGADGILVSRALASKEFIPFEDLSRVTVDEGDVVLERRGKAPLRLGFGVKRVVGREAGVYRDAFVERIEEARSAHALGLGASAPRVAALVARGDRSVREWVASIRGMAADGGYRDAALLPDQLWRIVEDPAAEASARAGAAIALAPVLDGEGRGRLRVAAEICAAPTLKAALTAAAAEQAEADAIEDALGAIPTARARLVDSRAQ